MILVLTSDQIGATFELVKWPYAGSVEIGERVDTTTAPGAPSLKPPTPKVKAADAPSIAPLALRPVTPVVLAGAALAAAETAIVGKAIGALDAKDYDQEGGDEYELRRLEDERLRRIEAERRDLELRQKEVAARAASVRAEVETAIARFRSSHPMADQDPRLQLMEAELELVEAVESTLASAGGRTDVNPNVLDDVFKVAEEEIDLLMEPEATTLRTRLDQIRGPVKRSS